MLVSSVWTCEKLQLFKFIQGRDFAIFRTPLSIEKNWVGEDDPIHNNRKFTHKVPYVLTNVLFRCLFYHVPKAFIPSSKHFYGNSFFGMRILYFSHWQQNCSGYVTILYRWKEKHGFLCLVLLWNILFAAQTYFLIIMLIQVSH